MAEAAQPAAVALLGQLLCLALQGGGNGGEKEEEEEAAPVAAAAAKAEVQLVRWLRGPRLRAAAEALAALEEAGRAEEERREAIGGLRERAAREAGDDAEEVLALLGLGDGP